MLVFHQQGPARERRQREGSRREVGQFSHRASSTGAVGPAAMSKSCLHPHDHNLDRNEPEEPQELHCSGVILFPDLIMTTKSTVCADCYCSAELATRFRPLNACHRSNRN